MSIIAADYIDQATLDDICDFMAEGNSVRAFFRDKRTDLSRNWFHVWLTKHGTDDQRTQYAHAQEDRQDALFEQCFEIADDGAHDTTRNRQGEYVPDNEWINRSKLRVETRFKALARMNPKRYGEKVTQEHTGKDGGPIQTETTARTLKDDELDARIHELSHKTGEA